jgi:hypothetical protein
MKEIRGSNFPMKNQGVCVCVCGSSLRTASPQPISSLAAKNGTGMVRKQPFSSLKHTAHILIHFLWNYYLAQ